MYRMSLLQSFNQGLRGILNVQSQQAHTQNQISANKRVLQPSDDPLAAARILQLEQEQSRLDQFQKNIDGVESSLMLEDTQLDAIGNLLVRVREIAVNAGNGSLSKTDRQALAAELETRLDELVNLGNTRNTSGEYIFGGFQGEQEPFELIDGRFSYRGDDGQRFVQIASSTRIATGDSGKAIFVAVPSPRLEAAPTAGNTGDATISTGRVVDQGSFESSFAGRHEIRMLPPLVPGDPPDSYEVVAINSDGSDGPTVVASAPFSSGEPIEFSGVQLRIVGAPDVADSFTVHPPASKNILNTVAELAEGLRVYDDSPDDKLRLNDLLAAGLDNLSKAEANVSEVRAKVGARLNTLDSTSELHQGVELVNDSVLADIRDLDYAEAISRLTMENFVLQAAQQSFAKISGMSLFNFMR